MQTTIAPAALTPIPAWIPARHRPALSGRRVQIAGLPVAVRRRLRTAVKIRVSEWAAQHRIVTDGAHEGQWRHEYAPHTVQIMDTFGLPHVREIWFCGPEQGCKTNAMLNCMGWCVDCDPGNIFYLMPTEATGSKVTGGKIIPMLRRSPRLRRYLSAREDDTSLARINLSHGVTIFPAHANSASSMATFTAKHCFGDEVDKYPAMTGREADPITLIRKRNRTYKGRYKRFFSSSPAGRFIYKGMGNCQQVWEHRAQCPDCDALIRLEAAHLVLPDEAAHDTLSAADVRYACPACGVLWDDQARERANRLGRWLAIKGAALARPETVGFHERAWDCLDISLFEIAVAWLKAQTGDLNDKTAWANGYECIDYVEEVAAGPEVAGLIDRLEAYAPMVPMEAGVLTAGVDIQMDRIEIEVVAFGISAQSWGLDYAVLHGDTRLPEVWEQLDAYLMQRWQHESGESLGITRAFVDSGYLPVQVYKFCAPRKGRGIYAIKGASTARAPEVQGPNWQKLGNVRCQAFNLGVNRLKSLLFGYFGIQQPGPGFCHIPDTYHADWFEHLTAEHVVTKVVAGQSVEVWEKVKANARNEAIDLRAYALGALLSLRIDIKGTVAMLKSMAGRKEEGPARPAARKSNFATRFRS